MTAGFPTVTWWGADDGFAWLGTVDTARAVAVATRIQQVNAAHRYARTKFEPKGGSDRRLYFRSMSSQAELGLAILVGQPWNGGVVREPGDHAPDVGDDIEVRWTQFQMWDPPLMVGERDRERAQSRFVLAVSTQKIASSPPILHYLGWLFGHEVMQPEYWRDDLPNMPAFLRPLSLGLRQMRTLS